MSNHVSPLPGPEPKYLTTVIPYHLENGTPNNQSLQVLIKSECDETAGQGRKREKELGTFKRVLNSLWMCEYLQLFLKLV